MITYIKKLIKKQQLLKKYKKEAFSYEKLLFVLQNVKYEEVEHIIIHNYDCELRCYNRLKKL